MDSKYYIVRAKDAGVFAGNIKERNGTEVTMTQCASAVVLGRRRILDADGSERGYCTA